MFGRFAATDDARRVLEALGRSLAIIEFDAMGRILGANKKFCTTVGYALAEIKGQHHSMFVAPDLARSPEYKEFWHKLGRGEYDAGEYVRFGKGGREIWVQASYNPILDAKGVVLKIVKLATDITAEKLKAAECESKLNAISRVQAIIEFTLGGEIITANEKFLDLMGYRLDEVKGQHHRLLVEPADAQSPDYQDFWRKLNGGEAISTSFRRIGKAGKQVWIQASYNPIFDASGKVAKIVKYASDITDLSEIGAGLARLADNSVDRRIEKAFSPTFEKLRVDFNVAHDNLRNALQQIAGTATEMDAGAQQISSAADDLSRRIEQQAASLEQTAAALDEITATVKKSAEGAGHAREVVAAADVDAKKGAAVVRQAVEAMDAIANSARQISQIIGVIDEIAFQTNLLALNAGVEAARAGEAGRGFAVVASEVRALAQRSAEAAKQIKGLISASGAQVGHGVALVAESGRSLERIMAQVADINSVMGEIASGAKAQSVGLEEVNTAVNQMDQVTQQNAAMVEEMTAASHSLTQEAARLSGLIGQFKTGPRSTAPTLRDALKKAAPHAFRAAASAPAPSGGGTGRAQGAERPDRREPLSQLVAKVRASARASAGGASGAWTES